MCNIDNRQSVVVVACLEEQEATPTALRDAGSKRAFPRL